MLGVPNARLVWAAVGVAAVFLLTRTTFGRTVYAIGNRERARISPGPHPSRRDDGVRTFRCSVGFRRRAARGLREQSGASDGRSYLLAGDRRRGAGGTSILGGRGSYLGTVAGVILITLLQSILSVMQMEEFGRHVTYGVVIIAMLLLYGRGRPHSE